MKLQVLACVVFFCLLVLEHSRAYPAKVRMTITLNGNLQDCYQGGGPEFLNVMLTPVNLCLHSCAMKERYFLEVASVTRTGITVSRKYSCLSFPVWEAK